jgi:zona occludens toxin
MISLIQGRPGSGKTYEAVKYHILQALKLGRRVVTNIPVSKSHVVKVFDDERAELLTVVDNFDTSDYQATSINYHFSNPEHYQYDVDADGVGVLFVVDECHFALPKSGTNAAVKRFYTMHRHEGHDIVLVTQQVSQVDRDILRLCEFVYKCTKASSLGSSKRYLKKVYEGYRGSEVNREIREYDSSIFKFYKSHSHTDFKVIEQNTADVKPFYKSYSMIFSVVCLISGCAIIFSSGFSSKPKQVVEASGAEVAQPQVQEIKHPLERFIIHFDSYMILHHSFDDKKMTDARLFFRLDLDGSHVSTVTSDSLYAMGYQIKMLSDDVLQLSYESYEAIYPLEILKNDTDFRLDPEDALKI